MSEAVPLAVEITGVTKVFGAGLHAIEEIDLTVVVSVGLKSRALGRGRTRPGNVTTTSCGAGRANEAAPCTQSRKPQPTGLDLWVMTRALEYSATMAGAS